MCWTRDYCRTIRIYTSCDRQTNDGKGGGASGGVPHFALNYRAASAMCRTRCGTVRPVSEATNSETVNRMAYSHLSLAEPRLLEKICTFSARQA